MIGVDAAHLGGMVRDEIQRHETEKGEYMRANFVRVPKSRVDNI